MYSTYKKERKIVVGIALGNLALMTAKLVFGVIGGSASLVADGIHSAADVVSSIVVFLSIKFAARPPDDQHPYGHGKVEAIAAGAIAFFLAGVALQIGWSAVQEVFAGNQEAPSAATAYIALGSILANEIMFQIGNRVGKKVGSQAMIANSWDNRSDALSSCAALAGILGSRLGYRFLDPLAAALVAILLMKVVFHLLKESGQELMDRAVADIGGDVVTMAESVRGVEHAYARVRRLGRGLLVDLKLEMDPTMSVSASHEIGRDVKAAILSRNKNISDVMIHIHPHDE